MECPWCPTEAEPRGLHRHLVEVHPEVVALVTQGSQARYELACPICGERLHRAVKPFGAGAAFLAEHREQVLLVAFDVLVHHLLVMHGDGEGRAVGNS